MKILIAGTTDKKNQRQHQPVNLKHLRPTLYLPNEVIWRTDMKEFDKVLRQMLGPYPTFASGQLLYYM